MRSQEEIAKDLEIRRKEIKRLEAELEEAKKLPEDVVLAEQLHRMFCTSNHTDGCGWTYESWDNPGHARKQWLARAHAAMAEGLTFEHIKKVKRILSM